MKKVMSTAVLALVGLAGAVASAQSFRVQCPASTITHPDPLAAGVNNAEPAYTGPTTFSAGAGGYLVPTANVNGAIKCQQVSGGDGYATMADGTQTYMFSFGPLSGLADIAAGQPGTEFPAVFNTVAPQTLMPGDPAYTDGPSYSPVPGSPTAYLPMVNPFTWNGAVGITSNLDAVAAGTCSVPLTTTGQCLDGHVDSRQIMDIGVMNGNIPAPLMAVDEDDEFFLTLTNVGMIMRPDLFEQHTIHWHGYPNASSLYDGVPDASVAINIGGSFSYYYLAADAGTYFWHCHITPPEHLQMGMVGQLYVRPRQDRVPSTSTLYAALSAEQADLRTACNPAADILCTNPLPAVQTAATGGYIPPTPGAAATSTSVAVPPTPGIMTKMYAYNDGDGSTYYDVEYPLQIHGFDPNFHFVGMTFNSEGFADMKDKYFILNGRSYPDTVTPGPLATQSSDASLHFSQPLSSIINIPLNGKALLRISDLDVSEYQTLASLGIRMHVIGYNAKLLRDQDGNNTDYFTNSITLAGGESLDVILDAKNVPAGTYYLYTPNLDHLANDAENFGGLMTEVHVCTGTVTGNTFGNTCN